MHPETVSKAAAQLKEQQASFVAAPVFGGNPIAVEGKLVFAVGGPRSATEVVKSLIQDVMGRRVIDCGEDATKASLLKIAGYVIDMINGDLRGLLTHLSNIVTVNMMEAVGEAQVFAEKTGLGTGTMEELIGEAFGAVAGGYSKRCVFERWMDVYRDNLTVPRLTTGAYAPPADSRPGFGVSLAIKDANHAMSMAEEHGVKLPGLEVARQNMETARDYAGECLDSSSMYGTLRQQAGLEFWNERSRKT